MLKTISLRIGYGKHILFDNLNLRLEAGKLVCFMGPNGAGKSSLLRTLVGIQTPLQGSVEHGRRDSNFSQIAVVLTDKIAASNLSVRELVALGRYPYLDWRLKFSARDKEAVHSAIKQTNLEHLADKNVFELSDGQLQMVMIARALAQDTPIIILDEPTAHLDLNNRVEIMKLLRALAKDLNKAILVATHELDLALQTADLIWLAGSDRDILTGIPEDLVLNGAFDEIFKFKGYDLKSGKVTHDFRQNKTVYLKGNGHAFLWTKNALERSGITVRNAADFALQPAYTYIEIENEDQKPRWLLKRDNRLYNLDTLAALIEHI